MDFKKRGLGQFASIFRISRSSTVIWLFALVGSLLPQIKSPLWFLNSPDVIDPWLYWGTGSFSKYLGLHLSDTYYFRRWTLNGPNWLFQNLLAPIEAQWILRTLILIGIMALAGLIVFHLTSSIQSAFFVIMIIASTDFLVRNIGMSYHQGTGLLLFLAIIFLTLQFGNSLRPQLLALATGILWGLSVVTYQFTLYLFPAFAVLLFFQLRLRFALSRSNRFFTPLIKLAIYGVVGFLLIVGLLDRVIATIFGYQWDFLLTYSFQAQQSFGDSFSVDPTSVEFWRDIVMLPATFGVAGLFLGLTCIVAKSVNSRSGISRGIWGWFTLTLALTFILGAFMKNYGLAYPWTNIYLAIVLVIALGLFIPSRDNTRDQGTINKIFGKIWVPVLIAWVFLDGFSTLDWRFKSLILLALGIVLLTTAVGFEGRDPKTKTNNWVRTKKLKYRAFAQMIAMISASSLVWLSFTGWYPTWASAPFTSLTDGRSFYVSKVTEQKSITDNALQFQRRVWIADLRPHAGWSTNVTSLYGMYSALTLGYPAQSIGCNQIDWILNFPNSSAVVFGAENELEALQFVKSIVAECEEAILEIRKVLNPLPETWWVDVRRP